MWRRSTSTIWLPTVNSGLSDVIGSWKTIAISLPRTRRKRRVGVVDQRLALPAHVAARDPPGQFDEPQQCLRRHALARAALADEAERLAPADREADVAHRVDDAATGEELDVEMVDLEQGAGRRIVDRVDRIDGDVAHSPPPVLAPEPIAVAANRFSRSCGSSATRSQLLSRLAASTVRLSRMPGIDDQPLVAEQLVIAGAGRCRGPTTHPGTGCRGRGS